MNRELAAPVRLPVRATVWKTASCIKVKGILDRLLSYPLPAPSSAPLSSLPPAKDSFADRTLQGLPSAEDLRVEQFNEMQTTHGITVLITLAGIAGD